MDYLTSERCGLLTPPGKPRVEIHNGKDFNRMCMIMAFEAEISSRKALEAFWIAARDPSMNNRNGCLFITEDLLPLASPCVINHRELHGTRSESHSLLVY